MIISGWYVSESGFKYNNSDSLPDFEVDENQLPSRGSYPVNRPASRQSEWLK